MDRIVPWPIFIAALGAVLGALAWLASRTRRRGVGLEVMGPVDQIYRPHTYQVHREIRAQEQRGVAIAPAGEDI